MIARINEQINTAPDKLTLYIGLLSVAPNFYAFQLDSILPK